MRFDIKKLESRGFTVYHDKDSIEIHAPPCPEATWKEIKDRISDRVSDPGLQDYVLGSYLTALNRAQVLELAE